jgi:hypothetical protein
MFTNGAEKSDDVVLWNYLSTYLFSAQKMTAFIYGDVLIIVNHALFVI